MYGFVITACLIGGAAVFGPVLKCRERLTGLRVDGFKRSRIIAEENPVSRQ